MILNSVRQQRRQVKLVDDSTPRPSGYVRVAGVDRDVQGTAGALPLNEWAHMAVTYGDGQLTLYPNGVPIGSLNQTGKIAVSSGQFTIGGNTVWGAFFAGLIENLRIYTRRLTLSEIQTNLVTPVP